MDPAISSLIDRAGLDRDKVRQLIGRGLDGADDGELFLEYKQAEALAFDNGRLKQASYDTTQGFGLRAVKDEAVGYAHASDLSEGALARAAEAVRAVKSGHSGKYAEAPGRTNRKLYGDDNPLGAQTFESKVKLLETMDAYARAKDPRVRQVTASVAATWQVVEILRADGESYRDIRPLVRLNVSAVVGDGDRQESGSYGVGGREGYERFITPDAWRGAVDEAVRQSLVNLDAVAAPAGEMDVVLGNGWPGVMLHEAVGHGLEGDFNRKKTSAFAGLMGQQVAAKGVTVIDDGTLAAPRGQRAVVDHGDALDRDLLTHQSGKRRRLLAIEIAFQPVADRFVQHHAGPAGAEHDIHLARWRRHRVEIDQRLAHGFVDRALPGMGLDEALIALASADPVAAGLLPVTVANDCGNVQPHQRTDVAIGLAVGAQDFHHLPGGGDASGDLPHARVLGAGIGVDRLQQFHFALEALRAERVFVAIKLAVGA